MSSGQTHSHGGDGDAYMDGHNHRRSAHGASESHGASMSNSGSMANDPSMSHSSGDFRQSDEFNGFGRFEQFENSFDAPGQFNEPFDAFDDPLPAGCIKEGPFANLTIRIGPMGEMRPKNERCLTRRFNVQVAHEIAAKKSLTAVLKSRDFLQFRMLIERGHRNRVIEDFEGSNQAFGWRHEPHIVVDGDLHNIGHTGIGGEMRDTFTSINDPIFFVHHAGLDRIWALWQEMDIENRLHSVGPPADKEKEPVSLGLDTPLWLGVFGPDRKVSDVFDTLNRDGRGVLCYKYEGLPASAYLL